MLFTGSQEEIMAKLDNLAGDDTIEQEHYGWLYKMLEMFDNDTYKVGNVNMKISTSKEGFTLTLSRWGGPDVVNIGSFIRAIGAWFDIAHCCEDFGGLNTEITLLSDVSWTNEFKWKNLALYFGN